MLMFAPAAQKLAALASRRNSEWAINTKFLYENELPSLQVSILNRPQVMLLLHRFLDPSVVSLKICGVTLQHEALDLVKLKVDALGFNFWPQSKRHLPEPDAAWLKDLEGEILRVGVFVNQPLDFAIRLFHESMIDIVQLHGDETPLMARTLRAAEVPFIKALGVSAKVDFGHAADFGAAAILLDTHAPGIYGGTGEIFDWNVAQDFANAHPALPLILAGGITPENAAHAAAAVHPVALDIASGAEISPGIKDYKKVSALLAALKR